MTNTNEQPVERGNNFRDGSLGVFPTPREWDRRTWYGRTKLLLFLPFNVLSMVILLIVAGLFIAGLSVLLLVVKAVGWIVNLSPDTIKGEYQ